MAHLRMKMLAACVGAVLAQWGSGYALADSAVGVDTALGNALNPPGRSALPPLADDGYDTVRHSPTGQLYGIPYDRPSERSKTADGWEYSGVIEAGVLGGDAGKKDTLFRKYKDLKNGPYLNYFEVEGDKPDSANFVQAFGGGAGQHDQFYGMQFGRYNEWKIKLFYNETIHVFSDTYQSLYNGVGTGNLTLAGGLKGAAGAVPVTATLAVGTQSTNPTGANYNANYVGPAVTAANNCSATAPCWSYGGKTYQNGVALNAINGVTGRFDNTGTLIAGSAESNIAASINGYLAGVGPTELALVRKKTGARLDMNLTDSWKTYASFSQEKRTGARPFGMNFGSGNMAVEIAEPIDYTTSDFLAGLQYVDKLTALNLRASASVFRNNIGSLTADNPLFGPVTPLGAITQSSFDLNPDNTAFNLKGEFARKLPGFFNGRFTASVAYGSNRQNDSLMAPLNPSVQAISGVAAGAGYSSTAASAPFNINNWNTTAALSQRTANQRLDTKLIDLGLTLKPIDDLSVKGSLRRYETDNKANDGSGHQYTAYNPLTGQYGVGIKYDNSITAVVGSSTGVVGSPCYTPNGTTVAGCLFNGPAALTAAQAVALGMPNLAYPANNPSSPVVYSLARDYKQNSYGLSVDYDLGKRSNIEGSLEREEFTRTMREREKTWENKFKLAYVNRGFDSATLRASFETDGRRGGEWNAGLLPNVPYYQQVAYGLALPGNSVSNVATQTLAGTVGYVGTNLNNYLGRYSAQSQKTDLANRDQNILNARLNIMARENLDFGVMMQLKNAKYPDTVYGSEQDNLSTVNFDINYQPSHERQFIAYYSRQDGSKKTTGNAGGGTCTFAGMGNSVATMLANCAMTTSSTTAGAGMYPATSVWNMNTKDSNDIFGLSFQQDLGTVRLGVDYSYTRGRTRIGYDYGSTVFPIQAPFEALLGNAMPDMTTVQNTLTLNLMVPIDKRLTARFMYRFEDFRVKDWHYDEVIQGQVQAMDGGTILLDPGRLNSHTNVFGVFIQYKL